MSFNGLLLLVDLQNESNIFGSLASQYFYFSFLGTFAKLTEASFGGQMVVCFITSFCSVAAQINSSVMNLTS